MADFEKTITSETGIDDEADSETTYEVETEDGVGLGDAGEYEHVAKGNVAWNVALDAADGDPVKAAESLQNSLDYYTLKKVSVEKTILQMEALSLQDRVDEIKDLAEYGHEVTLWCADYTLDLSGNVGIIEVPGEQTARIVQPGYESNAVYSGERDGQILPAIVSTPAAVFWNLAMMPGWQKWMPTYRYGAITWIDGDTCNVTLEEATSSQQGIDVNQSLELTDVPIDYMSCNGAVFSEGDLVLVKFTNQDFEQPRVIGFKSNPKPCESVYVLFEAYYDDGFRNPSRFVVWDAVKEELADLSAWGGPAVVGDYPCEEADLTAWLAATTAKTVFDEVKFIYNYDEQAEGVGKCGEEWAMDGDISVNTGCGELINEYVGNIEVHAPGVYCVQQVYECCHSNCPGSPPYQEYPAVTGWGLGYEECVLPAAETLFGMSYDLELRTPLQVWTLAFIEGGPKVILNGDTITGAISAASGLVVDVTVNSGSWAEGDAAGTLSLRKHVPEFEAEDIRVSGLYVAAGTGPAVLEEITSCYRTEYIWDFFNEEVLHFCDGRKYCGGAYPWLNRECSPTWYFYQTPYISPETFGVPYSQSVLHHYYTKIYRKHTPIGIMDDIIHDRGHDNQVWNHCVPWAVVLYHTWCHEGDEGVKFEFEDVEIARYFPEHYDDDPLDFRDPSKFNFYTDNIMVQLHFMHRGYARVQRPVCVSTPGQGEVGDWDIFPGHPTRQSDVAVAVDFDGVSATRINPLTQERITALELKLEAMMDEAGEAAPQGGFTHADLVGSFPYDETITDFNVEVREVDPV